MIYKIDLNITKVRQQLINAHVSTYTSNTAIVFVEAVDPDDACSQGIDELKVRVLESYNSSDVQKIVKTFDDKESVKKIRKISPYGK